ncbi:MAG: FAD-binding protein [Thermoleophilia bacterium]
MDRRTFLKGAALAGAAGLPGGWALLRPAGAPGATGAIGALRAATRGAVLVPADRGYAGARPGFNLRYEGNRPVAVLRAANEADVAAALRWAAAHRVRIAARSGGHSYAGYSTPTPAWWWTSRRCARCVWPRRGARGRRGADGGRACGDHAPGLVLPSGSCPSVGVSGLTLGGGMGLSGRAFGLMCDRLASARVVTPDGVVRHVAAVSDPDLFWALRGGGGGNFGIVTSFRFTPATARTAAWFMLRWPGAQAQEVLAAWLRWAPDTHRMLTSLCTLAAGGGGFTVTALGQFYGDEARLRRLLAPLLRVPGASLRTGTSGTFDLVRRWAGCLDLSTAECHTVGTRPGGAMQRDRFAAASGYLRDVPGAAGLRQLVRLAEARTAAGGALIFDAYGGAIRSPAPDDTAFVHRRERCCVQAYVGYGAGGQASADAWLAQARATLARVGSGFAYQNYIDPRQPGWAHAYYGANLARLQAVRRRVDPDGVLHFPQAIPA